MKLIKTAVISLCLMLGASCTLDLNQDPNAVDPSQAVPDLLLNTMQRSLVNLFNGASQTGMQMTRLQNGAGSTYANAIGPNGFDGQWSTAYAGILTDSHTLLKQADANGFARHAGIARVIEAYTILLMVDQFGDVPYSEAINGSGEFNPNVDPGQSVYDAALALLDKAILDLTTPLTTAAIPGYLSPVATVPQDQYYGNVYGSWVKLANTLKLKAYLNLRLDQPTVATAGITAAIAGGLILSQSENFMFHYGISTSDPDARHPLFVNNYPAGGGNYMSNWLMYQMYHGWDAVQNGAAGDPRIRFFFYRQELVNNTDPNNVRCATALQAPDHYPTGISGTITPNGAAGFPVGIPNNVLNKAWQSAGSGASGNLPRSFCYPTTVGYWGRDHVDPQGIPPDGFLRSAWGAYPAGGRFDNNTGADVSANVGMRGAGIFPIMMRSFTNFMLAEAALFGIIGGSASAYLDLAVRASMDDVRDFAVNGKQSGASHPAGPNEATTINTYYPLATYNSDRDAYLNHAAGTNSATDEGGVLTQFSFAGPYPVGIGTLQEWQMSIIAREYWVAAYGNGVEAFNLFRRTGMPKGLQPTIQATTSLTPFPRSYWYPQAFATLNASVEQKPNLGVRVFWDSNTSNLDF